MMDPFCRARAPPFDYAGAERELRESIRLDPKVPNTDLRWRSFWNTTSVGCVLESTLDFAESEKEFEGLRKRANYGGEHDDEILDVLLRLGRHEQLHALIAALPSAPRINQCRWHQPPSKRVRGRRSPPRKRSRWTRAAQGNCWRTQRSGLRTNGTILRPRRFSKRPKPILGRPLSETLDLHCSNTRNITRISLSRRRTPAHQSSAHSSSCLDARSI